MESDVAGELHLLTGAYALDALDPGERAAFETHLLGCESCRAEVEELLTTAGLLGIAAAETPPAGLKERVMAEVDRTRQVSTLIVTGTADEDAPGEATVVALPRRSAARLFQVAAAVLAILAVGLGAWGIQAHQRSNDLNAKISALNDVLAAPDAHVVGGTLKGSNVSGRATVVVSKSLGKAAFVGADLKPLPSGRTYELWFMTSSGKATPAGLVKVGSGGTATQLLSGTISDNSLVGVTVEPSGGSKQPTTTPVLAVGI
jgi:anti-sigma-K factor RskA